MSKSYVRRQVERRIGRAAQRRAVERFELLRSTFERLDDARASASQAILANLRSVDFPAAAEVLTSLAATLAHISEATSALLSVADDITTRKAK